MELMNRAIFNAIVCMVLFSSCNNENISPDSEENAPNIRALSTEEEHLINSSNNFSFELFRQINEEDKNKNIFISPLSIGTALAMTYNGASGNTKEQIQNTLGFNGMESNEVNKAYKDLQHLLLNMDKKTEFSIANSIWYRDSYTLQDGFSSLIKENYDGEIKPLDFNHPQSKDIINDWVEDKTQDKIKDLIKEVSNNHVMFLINAIYFKGTWTYKFDKSETQPRDFYREDGSVVHRETMFSDKLKFLYSHNENFQYISLPYGNEQFYMSILLPHENVSVDDIINNFDAVGMKELIQNADSSVAPLYLPKFQMEYEIVLNEALRDLGIKDAFLPGIADFSLLFESSDALAISKVNHKTFIEVDEEGTEAAAATSVEIVLTSLPSTSSPIRINRPFVFFIMEKSTENILFIGKILDPEE